MADLNETLSKYGVFTYPIDIPITSGNRERIQGALWAIGHQLDNDDGCYCEPECDPEDPRCHRCEMVFAQRELRKILTPIHRSLNPDREGNAAEEIYLRRWQQEQDKGPHVNYGYGLLEQLLTPTRIRERRFFSFPGEPYFVPPISQRDAEVAATVVQWLGTNCGRCFIESAEKEIAECRAERVAMEIQSLRRTCGRERVIPHHEHLARQAANSAMRPDDPNYEKLVFQIVAAIQSCVVIHEETFAGSGI